MAHPLGVAGVEANVVRLLDLLRAHSRGPRDAGDCLLSAYTTLIKLRLEMARSGRWATEWPTLREDLQDMAAMWARYAAAETPEELLAILEARDTADRFKITPAVNEGRPT